MVKSSSSSDVLLVIGLRLVAVSPAHGVIQRRIFPVDDLDGPARIHVTLVGCGGGGWSDPSTDLRQPGLSYGRFGQSLKTFLFGHLDHSAA